jgi:CRP/FNR family cyclic AMP-dependent transcriptional regulator
VSEQKPATVSSGWHTSASAHDLPEHLEDILMFRGLSRSQLDAVRTVLTVRRLRSGDVLLETDDQGEAAYIIHSGFVRIRTIQGDGDETTLAFLGPGDIVGEMSLVDRQTRSATVVAHEPVTLLVLNRALFSTLIERVPAIGLNLATVLSRRLRIANTHIMALATMDVEGRIAQQLLTYTREYGEPLENGAVRLPFHLTQSDIASLVGASRVRVNQILGEYRRSGTIVIDPHGHLTVTNPQKWIDQLAH